jgi:hypothetical protein
MMRASPEDKGGLTGVRYAPSMKRAGIAIFALSAVAGTPPAAAVEVLTGISTYELSLDPAQPAGMIASVSGELVQTVKRLCSGYELDSAMQANLAGEDGRSIPFGLKAKYREDGDVLHFSVKGDMGPMSVESAEGVARKTGEGISVSVTAPEERTIELKGNILFPVAATMALLQAAADGKRFTEFAQFDGSGGAKDVWALSATIGAPKTGPAVEDEAGFAAALGLDPMTRWDMQLSYFPPGGTGDQTPAFRSSALVYANGFSPAAHFDYGMFAMVLTLTGFEPLPPEPCP